MSPLHDYAGTPDAWTPLDQLLDELVERSRSAPPPQAFYRDVLERVVEGLAARGASMWEIDGTQTVSRMHRDESGRVTAAGSPATFDVLQPAAAWAVAHAEALALPPSHDQADDALPPNTGESLLLIQPIVVDETPLGAIVVEQRPDLEPEVRRGALRFLATVGDLTADYFRNRERDLLRRKASEAEELESLLSALYCDVDPAQVAAAAADDGRRWCGVDRISVLVPEYRTARMLATTGVAEPDRRAESIRKLERLAFLAASSGEAVEFPVAGESVAPQLAQALADYVEAAEPRSLYIACLKRSFAGDKPRADELAFAAKSPPVVGLLVLEQFATDAEPPVAARIETMERHLARALTTALDVRQIPLSRPWLAWIRRRGTYLRRARTAALVAVLAAALLTASFLVPARLRIEAAGTMQPRERRDVYAPAAAIVEEVLVDHGALVAADAPLVRLRRPDLEVEQARLLGELQTAERRLAALRSTRTSSNSGDAAERARRQESAAEEEQLKQTVAAAQSQLQLLARQQAELVIRAPIAGRVTTWDPQRLLAGRPVAHGDRLLHVADEAGPWVLELDVPENGYREVAAARAQSDSTSLEFVAAIGPQETYEGKLVDLASVAETTGAATTYVAATAEFDRQIVPEEIRRPGAVVTARIDCGPSSLGAVWTRDLLHYLRTQWWF